MCLVFARRRAATPPAHPPCVELTPRVGTQELAAARAAHGAEQAAARADAEALGAQLKEAQLEAKVAAGEAAKAEELARELEKLRTENERLNRKVSNLPPPLKRARTARPATVADRKWKLRSKPHAARARRCRRSSSLCTQDQRSPGGARPRAWTARPATANPCARTASPPPVVQRTRPARRRPPARLLEACPISTG